jgi:DNA-binding MarR family transcriptional regulator
MKLQELSMIAADEMAMFCRLQLYSKKNLPIRSSEMGVLIYVHKNQGGVTPLRISSFFQIAKPSVTAMINELIKNEYLVKEASKTDRRSYTVSLTEKGLRLVSSEQDAYFKSIALLEERMGPEDFETFVGLLKKANRVLGEDKK